MVRFQKFFQILVFGVKKGIAIDYLLLNIDYCRVVFVPFALFCGYGH